MNSRDEGFDWHVNGLYVALGPGNEVYTDTAETTAHGARASLLARTNKPWSTLQMLGYSIQGYVQALEPEGEVPQAAPQRGTVTCDRCDGDGSVRSGVAGSGFLRCAECNGDGVVCITAPAAQHAEIGTPEAPSAVGQLPEVALAELPANAMNFIDRANDALLKAVARNKTLQASFPVGMPSWHACESIDDHLHDALTALGQ